MKKFVESIIVIMFLVLISSVSFGCPSQGDDPIKEKKYEKACPYGDAVLVWKNDTDIVENSVCIIYDKGKKAFMSYDYDWNKGKKVYPAKEYPVAEWDAFTMDGQLIPLGNGAIKVYREDDIIAGNDPTYMEKTATDCVIPIDEIMQREADLKVANMYDEHWK